MHLATKGILSVSVVLLAFVATERVRVAGPSMEQTMHDGQYVLVNRAIYVVSKPKRGDVVVFSIAGDRGCDYIKRVIAIPGDIITVSLGTVWINGQSIAEPFVKGVTTGSAGPLLLAPNEYFVMGDNRTGSKDSRNFGPVLLKDVVGRASTVF